MIKLVLYGTLGCHLCDEAFSIVSSFQDKFPITLDQKDVAEDDVLFEQYGLSIPVLLNVQNGNKLYWPFNSTQVELLLGYV